MWGMNRYEPRFSTKSPLSDVYSSFQRPPWTTAVLIPGAFLCGIGAAVLIWLGGGRTKRVEEVRERLRKALEAKQPLHDLQHNQSRNDIDAAQTKSTMPHDTDEKSHEEVEDPDTFVDELVMVPPSHELEK
jgi:hypothetical protein